jgi:hypothetical protein
MRPGPGAHFKDQTIVEAFGDVADARTLPAASVYTSPENGQPIFIDHAPIDEALALERLKTFADEQPTEEAMSKFSQELKAGDVMPDGTIYADASPDTGIPMYTMPEDERVTMMFMATAAFSTIAALPTTVKSSELSATSASNQKFRWKTNRRLTGFVTTAP